MRSERKFAEKPFCAADSLVFSQLVYARLENVRDHLGKDIDGMSIRDFFAAEYFTQMFWDGMTDEDDVHGLFTYAAASRRYRDVKIRNVVAEYVPEEEKQFAAMEFELGDGNSCVAFRGTDGSLVGWKEDFNMAFMDRIPSQERSVIYMNDHFAREEDDEPSKIYVTGHSKGGNLAIYSALTCEKSVRNRIAAIYSHDAPGFKTNVLERLNEIKNKEHIKVMRYLPQSSVVGMILYSSDEYQVVKSKASGAMQHSAFSWIVKNGDFVYMDELTIKGEYNGRVLCKWLESATPEKRKKFFDSLFGVLNKNKIYNTRDFSNMKAGDILRLIGSLNDLDDDTKSLITEVIKNLVASAVKSITPFKGEDGDK